MIDLNFKNINRLYEGFTEIAVKEYWIEGQGWLALDEELAGKTYEKQLLALMLKGCCTVQLQITQANGKIAEPDYKMTELISSGLKKHQHIEI